MSDAADPVRKKPTQAEVDLDADLKPVAARYLDQARAQSLPPVASVGA